MDATHIIAILGTVIAGSWGVIVKMTLKIQELNDKVTASEVARVMVATECGMEKQALLESRLAAEGKLREAFRAETKDMWMQAQTVLVQTNKTLDGIIELSQRGQTDGE